VTPRSPLPTAILEESTGPTLQEKSICGRRAAQDWLQSCMAELANLTNWPSQIHFRSHLFHKDRISKSSIRRLLGGGLGDLIESHSSTTISDHQQPQVIPELAQRRLQFLVIGTYRNSANLKLYITIEVIGLVKAGYLLRTASIVDNRLRSTGDVNNDKHRSNLNAYRCDKDFQRSSESLPSPETEICSQQ
jgi:hypothetical protein